MKSKHVFIAHKLGLVQGWKKTYSSLVSQSMAQAHT